MTYGDLTSRIGQLATLYHERGIAQGDRVLLGVRDDVDTTVSQLEAIVRAERCNTSRSATRVQPILSTFPPSGRVAKEH